MTLITKPNLDNRQFQQKDGTILTMSGETNFVGVLKSKGVEIDANDTDAEEGYALKYIGGKIVLDELPPSDPEFNSERPTTRVGIPSVNVGGNTVTEFLEEYFFPSVPPTGTISVTNNQKQFGDNSGSQINWSVVRNTYPIVEIGIDSNGDTVYNILPTPTGENQSGNTPAIFTTAQYQPAQGTNQTNITYRLMVKSSIDEINTYTTQITWRHKRYWFKNSNVYGSGDGVQLTNLMNNGNSELTTNKTKTFTNYSLSGEYFYFAYPKSYGLPSIIVNGLTNTAWENTLFEINFTNSNGYIEPYYIFRSDAQLNASFNIQIS